MKIVVVPNALRDAINAAIDAALLDSPDAECDREIFYQQLLTYYHEHGIIPHFTIGQKVEL